MEQKFDLGVTTSYDLFKKGINRNVDPKKVEKKRKSIEAIGLQQPITVNRKFQVVDGQHRLEALKQLELPVHYLVSYNWKRASDTAEINTTQDSWNTLNWAEYQIGRGNNVIKEAMELAENYSALTDGRMTVTTALEMLNAQGRTIITLLKSGEYTFDQERAHKIFQILNIFDENPCSMKAYNQKLVRSIKSLYIKKGGLNKKAVERMVQSQYKWLVYNNEADMVAYLEDMYKKHLTKSK